MYLRINPQNVENQLYQKSLDKDVILTLTSEIFTHVIIYSS